jgi:hypothetical protein
MKGVKAEDVEKHLKRDQFVRELFEKDCQDRAKHGFIDEPLSAPKAQKAFKGRFHVALNSQRMYRLRNEVWAKHGLDDKGKPPRRTVLPGMRQLVPQNGTPLQAAARDPNDPLFNVAVVSTADSAQGEFLKHALEVLASRGMVDPELRVDGVFGHYATVSRFPKTS